MCWNNEIVVMKRHRDFDIFSVSVPTDSSQYTASKYQVKVLRSFNCTHFLWIHCPGTLHYNDPQERDYCPSVIIIHIIILPIQTNHIDSPWRAWRHRNKNYHHLWSLSSIEFVFRQAKSQRRRRKAKQNGGNKMVENVAWTETQGQVSLSQKTQDLRPVWPSQRFMGTNDTFLWLLSYSSNIQWTILNYKHFWRSFFKRCASKINTQGKISRKCAEGQSNFK